MTDIEYPVSLKAIDKFERQNPTISINVFGHEESVYPLRVSKYEDREAVNLLLISDEERQHQKHEQVVDYAHIEEKGKTYILS